LAFARTKAGVNHVLWNRTHDGDDILKVGDLAPGRGRFAPALNKTTVKSEERHRQEDQEMKIDCYLVVRRTKGREPRVTRVTQGRPSLEANEALIRLVLDAPDDIFDAPIVTVPVERRQMAVAIEVDEL
jgi:hypothetical protein